MKKNKKKKDRENKSKKDRMEETKRMECIKNHTHTHLLLSRQQNLASRGRDKRKESEKRAKLYI